METVSTHSSYVPRFAGAGAATADRPGVGLHSYVFVESDQPTSDAM